jgi:hypothetical protein
MDTGPVKSECPRKGCEPIAKWHCPNAQTLHHIQQDCNALVPLDIKVVFCSTIELQSSVQEIRSGHIPHATYESKILFTS